MDIETNDIDQDLSQEDLLIQSNEESFNSLSHLSPSTIIGTHPNEVITSINADNGYPVRQENGQRKTGPPPGKHLFQLSISASILFRRMANNSSSTWSWL